MKKKYIFIVLAVIVVLGIAIAVLNMQESYSYYHIESDRKAEIIEEDGFFTITPEEGIALVNKYAAEYGVDKLSEKAHVFEDWAGQEDTYLNIVHEYSNEDGNIRVRFMGIEDNDGRIDTIEVFGLPGKEKSEEFDRQLCGYYSLIANLVNPNFDVEKFLRKSRYHSREQDGLLFSVAESGVTEANVYNYDDDGKIISEERELQDIDCEYLIYTDKENVLERFVYLENEY